MKKYTCLRCGHKWKAKQHPRTCPKCNNPWWWKKCYSTYEEVERRL